MPQDIVACTETGHLYIAYYPGGCISRLSLDGDVIRWLPNSSSSTMTTDLQSPRSLSVTSRRLLVTSCHNNMLLLYDPDGIELTRVVVPGARKELLHAVETTHGTFMVSHAKPLSQVSEVDAGSHVIRVYSGRRQLGSPYYLALDSDGRVLVADYGRRCVLLLSSRLELERVLLDAEHHRLVERPRRLCYVEQTGQLVVSSYEARLIQIYAIRSDVG